MSFPTIPNITPTISLSRADIVSLLLASVAFEELGLAHVINAEGEKIQAVLGTLPGVSFGPTTISGLLSVNRSVEQTLRGVIKNQMLLQFKLEDILAIPPELTTTASTTSTTTTTTTTTTTSTTTTTGTVTAACVDTAFTNAIFANGDFISSASNNVYDRNVQVNGELRMSGSNNTFLGTTNVGSFSPGGSNNTFEDLNVGAPPIPFPMFNPTCLETTADIVINGNVNISSQAAAALFQGNRVWVNGSVSVTGGGILARDGITVSGGDFTYVSTGCFALYSQGGDLRINNGPYDITGLIYLANASGLLRMGVSAGGRVCGAVMSAGNVEYTSGGAQIVTNQGTCSPCVPCQNFCRA